ncbi:tryptophanyl-tRNA synthetase [Exophiala aquamarina CBS 119918]|uniref:tryptophan--tRNA ligase n=1 Tax=Exophiala aquamarina CBS 119918 TaxID=1182545 RepID=A0A072PPH4_9EURO|nr:tryptophanyl-tRNA synthetase [Exophiala aquamarina CBS 119918]KEF61647.1 tryptophanyl-tRNA synthetase [Exophiala aquamarina CBS 119918]
MPREERKQLRKESFASLLAIGLNNTGTTSVFFQSDVGQPLSEMTRLLKSKLNLPDETSLAADEATAVLKLGLFSYPVLQAADILLYDTALVPVGHDQLQHVEFARTLARGFNSYLTETQAEPVFAIPKAVVVPGKRVMSLRKPTQKMSKSDADPRSRISIIDSPEEIRQKIKGATTDSISGISYDPEKRPGVSNLIEIYKHVTETPESCDTIAQDNQIISMQGLKDMVASAITKELEGTRSHFLQLMDQNNETLSEEIQLGATRARAKAGITFSKVQQSLGIS